MAICDLISQRDGYQADLDSDSSSLEEERYQIVMPTFECTPTEFKSQMETGFSELLQTQLASQGFHVTEDGSGAFFHDSTKSIDLIWEDYKLKGLNMDSGAILQRFDTKTLCACVVDGISAYHEPAAFAAHLFAELLITKLARHDIDCNNDGAFKILRKVAKDALSLCGKTIQGGATIGFVTCQQNADKPGYKAFVAALGDVAIYHYSTREKRARQINQIFRQRLEDGSSDICDTGGSLTTDGKLWGEISVSQIDIAPDDLLLLATDGLYDNLLQSQAADILSYVLHCPFFDKEVSDSSRETLPTLQDLQSQIPVSEIDQNPLTPERIVKRVNRYLKQVCKVGKPDDIMLLCIRPAQTL